MTSISNSCTIFRYSNSDSAINVNREKLFKNAKPVLPLFFRMKYILSLIEYIT